MIRSEFYHYTKKDFLMNKMSIMNSTFTTKFKFTFQKFKIRYDYSPNIYLN
jgi:hypothetical protein